MSLKNDSIFFTDHPDYDLDPLDEAIAEHLEYTPAKDKTSVQPIDSYTALSLSIRDRLIRNWLRTQHEYEKHDAKRVYYLSMEFLMGRLLGNTLINLGVYEECADILKRVGFDLEEIRDYETDMGLGNGGLGRLAACFLDSMATLQLPAYGYGIHYEFGIFRQLIENGRQMEMPDSWQRYGCPWEILRPKHIYHVDFKGRVESEKLANGEMKYHWVDTEGVMALAHDVPIPGYRNSTVNNLRLWQAKATREFDFNFFNDGNYMAAVEMKNRSENISKVLYPNDSTQKGKILRLQQEYFFVSASIQDIIKHYDQLYDGYDRFPDYVAIQLNDTHPALAVAELMRIFLDEKDIGWAKAWNLTTRTIAYTNHTVLPEALEEWPLDIIEEYLPRHLQITYEINKRHLDDSRAILGNQADALNRMSIINENGHRTMRMANLAIAGSHSVNGVSELHTKIITERIFDDFYKCTPEKFNAKTNGITPRRWLKLANPELSNLITEKIGDGWVTDLDQLRGLEKFIDDKEFQKKWQEVKAHNKRRMIEILESTHDVKINPDSMFDVQVKRIHEYKRQLLNILHVINFYNYIKDNPTIDVVPRTVIFGGKAAPAYILAKDIIQLINCVAKVINADPDIGDKLKVIFAINYDVTMAERLIPASDLSEQISTAGYEASGTGNMKFALNGALTIGTLDGANVEMAEEIGAENMLIFGLTAPEVNEIRTHGHNPKKYYESNADLKRILNMIRDGFFTPDQPDTFKHIFDLLVNHGDHFLLLADFEAYIDTQKEAARLFLDKKEWTQKSILNVARIGKFSSDRTIAEYAKEIWNVKSIPIEIIEPRLDPRH